MVMPTKPTALKLLHGNAGKRALNRKEPKFDGLPKCPKWLLPAARKEWKRIMSEFAHLGLITSADLGPLASYCQSFARWQEAEEILNREGSIIQEEVLNRNGGPTGRTRVKRHPASIVSKDEKAAMHKAASLFGFDPASRTRVVAPEQNEDEDSNVSTRNFAR